MQRNRKKTVFRRLIFMRFYKVTENKKTDRLFVKTVVTFYTLSEVLMYT